MYIYVLSQARTQTFEKGAASLRVFTKGCANHKKILILRPKVRSVNSVSGKKKTA